MISLQNKPLMVIQAPIATRSGYGDMSRDIARQALAYGKYEVRIISTRWGATPMNALDPSNPKDTDIFNAIVFDNKLDRQPDVFVQISVPNEFQPIGKFNVGITAGIETTICSVPWIEGLNRMDVNFAISTHAVNVLKMTGFQERDQAGNVRRDIKLEKPIDVLHNCVDTDIFKQIDSAQIISTVDEALLGVKEKFNFLFVGHWLRGDIGHDRKDVGMLVKTFLETFKNIPSANRPGLILKTSSATFSVLDEEEIHQKVREIKKSVNAANLPNIYILHGELTEPEMNSLYNHPKVKAHVSFTKGEGFGRPLLEASVSGKPVIASGWSGHLDFLNAQEAFLLPGELRNVHPSSVWDQVILAESQWFYVNYQAAAAALMHIFKNYKEYADRAKKLAKKNSDQFSKAAIQKQFNDLMDKHLPAVQQPVELKLPMLKKISIPASV